MHLDSQTWKALRPLAPTVKGKHSVCVKKVLFRVAKMECHTERRAVVGSCGSGHSAQGSARGQGTGGHPGGRQGRERRPGGVWRRAGVLCWLVLASLSSAARAQTCNTSMASASPVTERQADTSHQAFAQSLLTS